MKLRSLGSAAILSFVLVGQLAFAETCPELSGTNLPSFYGSGICTGNNQVIIELPGSQFTLYWNLHDRGDKGAFGQGWRASGYSPGPSKPKALKKCAPRINRALRGGSIILSVLELGYFNQAGRTHPQGYSGAFNDLYVEPLNPFAKRAGWRDLHNDAAPQDSIGSVDLDNGATVHMRNPFNVAAEAANDLWSGTLDYVEMGLRGLTVPDGRTYRRGF